MNKKIVVFGSFVVDLMGRAPKLPVEGETIKGKYFKMGAGGKGFNQGVASHKSGGDTVMVTKLGKDSFSKVALDTMKELGMVSDRVFTTEEQSTGIALILVDENTGKNQILVVPGACDNITDEEVESIDDLLVEGGILLTQLETNISSINKVVEMAHAKKMQIVLNTAPVQPVSDELLSKIDIVTPNEVEAKVLTGVEVTDLDSANKAAEYFLSKGVKKVIITLGENGVYINTGDTGKIIPAFKVDAIDTTGAGDAFNGGFVTKLAEGASIEEAVVFGSALAALSVCKLGTTPAMPIRQEIEEFLSKNK